MQVSKKFVRLRKKWEIPILLIVIAASFLFVFTVYADKLIDERAYARIKDCERLQSRYIPCAEEHIQGLLNRNSASDVMDELARRYDPINCHVVAHTVGKLTYKKYKNTEPAFDECNSNCNQGCSHGVIGEAFISEAGLDEAEFDSAHLSAEEMRKAGKKLCSYKGACHGVGHALYQTFGDIDEALAMCDEIATDKDSIRCYRGVLMEYVDILTIGGFRETIVQKPDVLHPESVCTQDTLAKRQACFRYFARISLDALRRSGLSSQSANLAYQDICASLSGGDRQACFAGLGVNNVIKIFTDPAAAQDACSNLGSLIDRQSCALGMVSSGIEYDRFPEVLGYCSQIQEDAVQASCYQNAFFSLDFRGNMMEPDSRMECTDDVCRKAAERYYEDPWMHEDP